MGELRNSINSLRQLSESQNLQAFPASIKGSKTNKSSAHFDRFFQSDQQMLFGKTIRNAVLRINSDARADALVRMLR